MLSKTETINHKLHCLFKYEVLLTSNFELVEQNSSSVFEYKYFVPRTPNRSKISNFSVAFKFRLSK